MKLSLLGGLAAMALPAMAQAGHTHFNLSFGLGLGFGVSPGYCYPRSCYPRYYSSYYCAPPPAVYAEPVYVPPPVVYVPPVSVGVYGYYGGGRYYRHETRYAYRR
jgi:hypothetical protein